jgi:hypothetical protein
MKLYDFNQKVSYEFLEASDIQSGTKETGSTCQDKSNKLNFNK